MSSTPNIGVVSGTPNTGLENSNKLVRAVDPVLHFYKFDRHPFASLVMTQGQSLVARENSNVPKLVGKALRKKGYSNIKVEWFEDSFYKREYSPTAAVAASDTSVTVAAADDDYFRAGDILLLTNASGQTERLIIASVATNTLNVTNPDGTARTVGIVMTTGDKFYLMENVRAEDSEAPSIRTTKSANMYNYMEIISEPYGTTKIKQATGHYTGDPMLEEKRKAQSRFLERLEMMFILGTRDVAASGTNPKYHCGGLKYWIESYTDSIVRDLLGRAVTKAELDSFIMQVCKGGSARKIALVDSRMLTAINGFGYSKVQINNFRNSEIGSNVQRIFGPMGELDIVYEPLFDQIQPLRGSMMIVDMEDVEYVYLEGNGINLDIWDEPQVLANGSLSTLRQIVAVCGLKFNTLQHFGWLKNGG